MDAVIVAALVAVAVVLPAGSGSLMDVFSLVVGRDCTIVVVVSILLGIVVVEVIPVETSSTKLATTLGAYSV